MNEKFFKIIKERDILAVKKMYKIITEEEEILLNTLNDYLDTKESNSNEAQLSNEVLEIIKSVIEK